MTDNETPESPDAAERREAVRLKAQKVQARIRGRKIARRAAITVGAVALVGVGAWAVWNTVEPELERETVEPSAMTGDAFDVGALQAIATGSEPAEPAEDAPEPVQIDVYVDYFSEDAGAFERANSTQLMQWVEEGAVELAYHPVSLLSGQSNGTQYSPRAAASVVCVVEYSPASAVSYNHALLADQPAPESGGLTDSELADLAEQTGATDAQGVRDCITEREFTPWIADATDRALEGPLPGTDDVALTGSPMILVDGRPYEGLADDPAEFAQFVLTVSSEQYYGTTTPEPTEEPDDTE